ncbi:MAG: tRNA-dihydrouridine synthase [Pseudomonadales bacterium]
MRLFLAPMQGVVDHSMREMLTRIGGFDRCVTEFVRVTNTRYPEKVFKRYCPELLQGGTTEAGTPVYVQFLGGNPHWMAANAAKAARLGAPGIDLNFGCPAKIVNRNDGGSILLKEPERVAAIVKAVRDAVDPAVPVTAKIRLGFKDASLLSEIAGGIEEAGASELCIHARTREDGYKPPAYWQHIHAVRSQLNIPVIANGEIWTVADALEAQQQSGCVDLMLGRGALACPDLALAIKRQNLSNSIELMAWNQVVDELADFFENCDQPCPKYVGNRTKQWLSYLRRQYPQAELLFQRLKRLRTVPDILSALDTHRRFDLQESFPG